MWYQCRKHQTLGQEKILKIIIPPPLGLSARKPESGGIPLRNCKSEMSNNSYIQMGMDMKGNMFAADQNWHECTFWKKST